MPSGSSASEENPNSAPPTEDFSGDIPTTEPTIEDVEGLIRQVLGHVAVLKEASKRGLAVSTERALDASNDKNKHQEMLETAKNNYDMVKEAFERIDDGAAKVLKSLQDMRERIIARGGAQ